MTAFRPVLLPAAEIDAFPSAFGYPADVLEAAIETKAADSASRHGVFEAAELMLREAAVAIHFVDINKITKPAARNGSARVDVRLQLGYNDHGGGSESAYKILLNCFPEGKEASQYVLFSPPEADGTASNTTFHRADFTFLSWEPTGIADKFVPNPLKTADAAHSLGRNDYQFYLVGKSSVRRQLPEAFKAAGFSFDNSPYDDDTYYHYRDLEAVAEAKREAAETFAPRATQWPREQFAAQIEALRQIEQTAD